MGLQDELTSAYAAFKVWNGEESLASPCANSQTTDERVAE